MTSHLNALHSQRATAVALAPSQFGYGILPADAGPPPPRWFKWAIGGGVAAATLFGAAALVVLDA